MKKTDSKSLAQDLIIMGSSESKPTISLDSSTIVSSQESNDEVSCIDLTHESDEIEVIEQRAGVKRFKRRKKAHTRARSRSRSVSPIYENVVDLSHSPSPSTSTKSPNVNISNDSNYSNKVIKCPICLEDEAKIQAHNGQMVSTVCGHIFCKDCIQIVIKTSKNCPKCRRKLSQKQYHPIFF